MVRTVIGVLQALVLSAAAGGASLAIPSQAEEPTADERLRHVESSIYWRQRSYERAESRRQALIADQLGMNDIGRARAYASGPGGVVFYRQPLPLDAAYGVVPRAPGPGVFEPWPYVPGDIWGYRAPVSTPQPIGQQQVQTGPNRWESFPIYEQDLAAGPPPSALPLQSEEQLPSLPPPPRAPSGPRAF